MAFTEQDRMNQKQEIERLADELSRLNTAFASTKKAAGIAPDAEIVIADSEMTPALEQALAEAKDEAVRAGRARATQAQLSSPAKSSPAAPSRRRGIRV